MQLAITETKYKKEFYYYQEDAIIGKSLEWYGEYQEGEIEFLKNTSLQIQAHDKKPIVAWDIGANIGSHTTAFAGWSREVHAFEAHPDNYKLLELNAKDIDNAYLYNYAVGNGTEPLAMTPLDQIEELNNFGFARISDRGLKVMQMRLDDHSKVITPPTVIKLDVEGYEIHALNGAEKTIIEHKPLMSIEGMEHTEDIIRWFDGKGYNLYWGALKNFNPGNFKNNQNLFLVESSAIFTILACRYPCMELEGRHKILDHNDHWSRLTTPE